MPGPGERAVKRPGTLADLDRRATVALAAVCAGYLVIAIVLMNALGFLENAREVVFSSPDSLTYLRLADFIAGRSDAVSGGLVAFRPFLFPLYLVVAGAAGAYGLLVLQLILNACSVGIVFLTVRRLTGSTALACAGAGLLMSSMTFTLAALHALTMSLAVFLIAWAVFLMASYFLKERTGTMIGALFFLSAAACVKPVFLPFMMIWLAFVIWETVSRRELRRLTAISLVAALSPVWAQLAFSLALTGHPTFSSVGRIAFEDRFFPAVYGFATRKGFVAHGSPAARQAASEFPTLSSKAGYVATHPRAMLAATIFLLRHNLLAGSPFVREPHRALTNHALSETLYELSRRINRLAACLHLAAFMAALWLVFAQRDRSFIGFLVLTLGLVYSVLISSALTYWQGDRIVTACLPAWAALYPAMAYHLARSFGPRRSCTR